MLKRWRSFPTTRARAPHWPSSHLPGKLGCLAGRLVPPAKKLICRYFGAKLQGSALVKVLVPGKAVPELHARCSYFLGH